MMDELIKVARAILEDFDLYGQPISLRLLAELRRAVEAAQQSVQRTACPVCQDNRLDGEPCPVCERVG